MLSAWGVSSETTTEQDTVSGLRCGHRSPGASLAPVGQAHTPGYLDPKRELRGLGFETASAPGSACPPCFCISCKENENRTNSQEKEAAGRSGHRASCRPHEQQRPEVRDAGGGRRVPGKPEEDRGLPGPGGSSATGLHSFLAAPICPVEALGATCLVPRARRREAHKCDGIASVMQMFWSLELSPSRLGGGPQSDPSASLSIALPGCPLCPPSPTACLSR